MTAVGTSFLVYAVVAAAGILAYGQDVREKLILIRSLGNANILGRVLFSIALAVRGGGLHERSRRRV